MKRDIWIDYMYIKIFKGKVSQLRYVIDLKMKLRQTTLSSMPPLLPNHFLKSEGFKQ